VLGPTKLVVDAVGTKGSCPLIDLLDPRVYFGGLGISGFKTGS